MQSLPSLLLVISFLGFSEIEQQKTDPIDFSGYWEGSLSVGAVKLRFSFHFSKSPDSSYSGKLNSLDESLENLPVKNIRLEERKLTFEVPTSKATFTGTISDDKQSIRGSWKGGQTLPLTLKKVDKPTVLNRPQLPKKPYPYIEEELTIENKKAKIQLSCTLTKPKGEGPFPCTVLISGSGPQDRDESLLGHKPFLVLADHLTRHGIAVLRFDDRGVGKSSGKFAEATSEDFASDVTSIVEHLKTRKEIDPKKIGLLGHSEGGIIAPMIAADSNDIAFIVMLSGPGLPGSEIVLTQSRTISKKMKIPESSIETNAKFLKKMIPLVIAKAPKEQFDAAEKEFIDGLSTLEQFSLKFLAKDQLKTAIKQISSPWFQFFLKHDPRPVLKKVKCPVLAINGDLDLQVYDKDNLQAIEKSLREGDNRDYTTKSLPGLNHLFQHAKTGLPDEYGVIEETFSPEALKLITEWIESRVKAK